jgi:hypothetical protein
MSSSESFRQKAKLARERSAPVLGGNRVASPARPGPKGSRSVPSGDYADYGSIQAVNDQDSNKQGVVHEEPRESESNDSYDFLPTANDGHPPRKSHERVDSYDFLPMADGGQPAEPQEVAAALTDSYIAIPVGTIVSDHRSAAANPVIPLPNAAGYPELPASALNGNSPNVGAANYGQVIPAEDEAAGDSDLWSTFLADVAGDRALLQGLAERLSGSNLKPSELTHAILQAHGVLDGPQRVLILQKKQQLEEF